MGRARAMAVALLGCVLGWPSAGRPDEPAAERPGRTEILAEFPIPREPSLLTVPVTFRGKAYQFIVDTGSSWMVYDKEFEDQLGPSRGAGGAITWDGEIPGKYYDAPDAHLGPLSLKTPDKVVCLDLGVLDQLKIGRVYGVIGMSFLKDYAVVLDFGHHKLSFRHEVKIADWARIMPLRLDRFGLPLIDVDLPDGTTLACELDTGANGTSISVEPSVFDRLAEKAYLHEVRSRKSSTLGGGEVALRSAQMYQATYAGAWLWVNVVDEAKDGPGQVGMLAIRRLNLILDFPRRRMAVRRAFVW